MNGESISLKVLQSKPKPQLPIMSIVKQSTTKKAAKTEILKGMRFFTHLKHP